MGRSTVRGDRFFNYNKNIDIVTKYEVNVNAFSIFFLVFLFCFTLLGALFLDGGVDLVDKIFAKTLFDDLDLVRTWKQLPLHPLQEDEPEGDRHWVESSPALQVKKDVFFFILLLYLNV